MADVAVLIPVFNDQRGLDRTIDQLPSEEILDVVIVDDGSRAPIQASSSKHRIHLIRLPSNRGIETALNAGIVRIRAMKFDYVARLDAGDIALPGRFAKQLQFLKTHPDYVLVGSHLRHIDMAGKVIEDERFPLNYPEILAGMHRRPTVAHPAVMFRLANVPDPVYRTDYPAAEDYELFWRLARQAPMANLDEVLTLKEENPNGISSLRCRRQAISALRLKTRYFDFRNRHAYQAIPKEIRRILIPDHRWRSMKQKSGVLSRVVSFIQQQRLDAGRSERLPS